MSPESGKRLSRTVGDETVDLSVVRRGYADARERFHAARMGDDPVAAFLPLFEALNWAASIDEGLGYPDYPEIRGMRFARNRVHHQWADALYVATGASFPLTFPATFFEWCWRKGLPEGGNRRDEPAYLEHLAGKPARHALDRVADFLAST